MDMTRHMRYLKGISEALDHPYLEAPDENEESITGFRMSYGRVVEEAFQDGTITEKESYVLCRRCGIDTKPMTYRDLAADMGVSGEGVRRIDLRGLHKLAGSPASGVSMDMFMHDDIRSGECGPVARYFAGALDSMRRKLDGLKSDVEEMRTRESPPRTPGAYTGDQVAFLDQEIYHSEFSNRVKNRLESASMRKVGELVWKSASDLMRIYSFGKISLQEVRRVLMYHGLHLDGENQA